MLVLISQDQDLITCVATMYFYGAILAALSQGILLLWLFADVYVWFET